MIGKLKGDFLYIYDKHYLKLLIIPFALILASILFIGFTYATTGEFFKKDVSLKGGVTITIPNKVADIKDLEDYLNSKLNDEDVVVRSIGQGDNMGLIIDAGVTSQNQINVLIGFIEEKIGKLSKDEYSVRVIGSSLGQSFFREAIIAILVAFGLMAFVVLIYFRSFIPSLIVIWAVFADIICTFATLVFLGEHFSSATIAALLLLIGFSVDTDILLTARVLKHKEGSVFERTVGALGTGLTLSLSALVAVFAGFILTQSDVIRQIMLVLVIGLIFDIIHTWITNAGVLRFYLERKNKVKN